MNVSKLMALFHLSFVLLSLIALFLMAAEVIVFDWLALWIIVLAVALNAFFGVMWYDETSSRRRIEKKEPIAEISRTFSMVSFVTPAHNQEQNISHCVKSLFNWALNYRGPSEIIIVDDGSTDNTYEVAWSTLGSLQKEMPGIHVRVLKHMVHLGREEAIRTGANKATGEYVVLVDATTPCDYVSLNSLIDTISSTQKTMLSCEIRLPPREGKIAASTVWLYRADVLRRILNDEQAAQTLKELKF